MCICISTCLYVYACIYIYICLSLSLYIYIYVYIYVLYIDMLVFQVYTPPHAGGRGRTMHDHNLAQVRPRVMPPRAARSVAKMAIDGRRGRENKCGLDGESMGVDVAAKADQTRVSYQGGGGLANNIEGSKVTFMVAEPGTSTTVSGDARVKMEAVSED